jgi:uncharacterized protein
VSLFLSLLPLYIFGNLHCLGMCGPLVMLIGRHRFRHFYFLGRILSFSLAALAAGAAGEVLNLILHNYHVSAMASWLFGAIILIIGLYSFRGAPHPGQEWLARRLSSANRTLSLLILKDQPWPTFLFGFFTVALPCGQTLVVFSACAIYGSAFVGLINGFAFALLTSPSLVLAMRAHLFLKPLRQYYNKIMGICSLLVGMLAICRGFAEADWIDHWILNPEASPAYHIVLY